MAIEVIDKTVLPNYPIGRFNVKALRDKYDNIFAEMMAAGFSQLESSDTAKMDIAGAGWSIGAKDCLELMDTLLTSVDVMIARAETFGSVSPVDLKVVKDLKHKIEEFKAKL